MNAVHVSSLKTPLEFPKAMFFACCAVDFIRRTGDQPVILLRSSASPRA
jgi:hypothetical protein